MMDSLCVHHPSNPWAYLSIERDSEVGAQKPPFALHHLQDFTVRPMECSVHLGQFL